MCILELMVSGQSSKIKGALNMAFSEAEYSSWIRTSSGISQKGQSDLVSRLRRADRLVPIDKFSNADDFHKAVTSSQNWDLIPKKSQDSVLAASRRYFQWLDIRNEHHQKM